MYGDSSKSGVVILRTNKKKHDITIKTGVFSWATKKFNSVTTEYLNSLHDILNLQDFSLLQDKAWPLNLNMFKKCWIKLLVIKIVPVLRILTFQGCALSQNTPWCLATDLLGWTDHHILIKVNYNFGLWKL